MKLNRYLSLLVVVLLLIAATISVKKQIFGKDLTPKVETEEHANLSPITTNDDGSQIIHTGDIPLEDAINGYAGPVPLNITIKEGKIASIDPLPNSETPSFFNRALSVLDNWIGKTPKEGLEIKPDAVSGATYSSYALIKNVEEGLAYYQGTQADSTTSIPVKIWIAFAVTLAACVIPLFVKNKIYTYVQLIANVAVLGFWCGQFLDFHVIIGFLADGVTLPIGLIVILMLIAAFIYPLFGHPQYYCTHICPLGSAQQIIGQICGHKIHLSKKLIHILDWFRKILWAVLLLLLWFDTFTEWMDYELFQAFQIESASWWIIGIAIVFLILSAIVNRPYCRFVCPTGSIFKRAENIG